MKTMIGLLMALALAGVVAAVVLEQNAIGAARAEQKVLTSESEEARRLTAQNQGIEKLRAENEEVVKLREENKELLKLRNEVRRLRRDAEGLGQLRSENQGLEARLKSVSQPGQPVEIPADYIKRDALMDAGQATPEATVQTFFWAQCQGKIERAADCELSGRDYKDWTAEEREKEGKRMADGFRNFSGFRIAGKHEISPDEVELDLQSNPGGSTMPMKLKRTDAGWKLGDD